MAYGIDVYVSYAHVDNVPAAPNDQGWVAMFTRALEARMRQRLGTEPVVYLDERPPDGKPFDEERRGRLKRATAIVAIVSTRSLDSDWVQREVAFFVQAHVRAGRPAGTARLFTVLLDEGAADAQPGRLRRAAAYPFFSVDRSTGATRMLRPTEDGDFWFHLDNLVRDIGRLLQQLDEPGAGRPLAWPVQLGVSAPRQVRPGGVFTARFAAYALGLAREVEERLRELDAQVEGGTHRVLGLSPDRASGWRVGAPVTVRLTGRHLRTQPSTRAFEWNGHQNIVSFLVDVDGDAPPGEVALCFEALIEGVPLAFIPLTLTISTVADTPEREMIVDEVARTAFASYASADAPLVAACLSALQRWSPDLNIFMDCLDLTPNGDWQQELHDVIPRQDAFLLFWSVNASQSPWVAWEFQHARASKGLDWIRPMPLEDPAIAPPPDELKHLNFNDRYLIARQAFLRRSDPAAGQ